MNRYKLSKAGISANEGIERFGGNAVLYEEMLMQFPQDTHFKEMCEAIHDGNGQTAFEESHALKGITGNLSMKRIYEDIVPLVDALRDLENKSIEQQTSALHDAQEFLPKVVDDYEDIMKALLE